MGALLGDVFEVGQHLSAEMRQNEAFCLDLRPMLDDVWMS